MPCPGPKEHQSQAHGSNSGTLKRHWMLGKWPEKSIFCMFSNFFHFFATSGPGNLWKLFSTWKCLPVDIFSTIFGDLEQILGLKLPHPTIGMAWKIIFLPFFKFLLLFGFQMTKYGAEYIHRKVFSCAELFSQVSRSTGCQKVEEIWQNAKMLIFRPFAQCSRSLQSARIWSKSSIFWCSLGPWWGFGICKVVSQCLLVFSRQLEGSKMT